MLIQTADRSRHHTHDLNIIISACSLQPFGATSVHSAVAKNAIDINADTPCGSTPVVAILPFSCIAPSFVETILFIALITETNIIITTHPS